MALQSPECVKDSTKIEAPELSRRESARIKDKRIAEKELRVRQRVELLNAQPDVAVEGGRRKRIKHCYSRRASVKNAHGEVEKISDGFDVADKPVNRSLEAENTAVTENGTASIFEKSDYAKVKDTLRVFNKHYLHFVQVSLFSFDSAIIDSSRVDNKFVYNPFFVSYCACRKRKNGAAKRKQKGKPPKLKNQRSASKCFSCILL